VKPPFAPSQEDIPLTTSSAPDTANSAKPKKPRARAAAPSQTTLAATKSRKTKGAEADVTPVSDTLKLATHALEEMKAEETIIIDLEGKTSIADHMIIASGRSNRHVGSIADEVVKVLKEAGHPSPKIEGVPHCDWVLVDCGDVIVHIFRPEVRAFYNLEKMWGVDRPTELAAS
jgi:ribosome-associated protein